MALALLCAALSAWAAYASKDRAPWLALSVAFIGYAAALAAWKGGAP